MAKVKRLVGGLLVRDRKLLLGKRSPEKRAWANAWDMPGGHVKNRETFEQALLREIEEEIGVAPEGFTVLADWETAEGEPYRIFRIDGWRGGEPHLRNDEHTELGWFAPAEAAGLRPLAEPRYAELFLAIEAP